MTVSANAPTHGYPFELPAVAGLGELTFDPVTILVGENGSGKSTLIEALAVAAEFNVEGGSKNLKFETHSTHSQLGEHLWLRWKQRTAWGWFLRAETFYGMASHIANDNHPQYGLSVLFPDLHGRSHGESFLELIQNRMAQPGLYIMDEPESALSFQGQLRLLRFIHDGLLDGSQFVIATHSPVLMRMPGAAIYELGEHGIERRDYDDLAVVNLWRRFLAAPERLLDVLFEPDEPGEAEDLA